MASSPVQSALNWIDAQQGSMMNLLSTWAEINSGTFNPAGLRTLGRLVADKFRPIADSVTLRPSSGYELVDSMGQTELIPLGKNLHVVRRSQSPLKVLLAIHMDTVYGVDSTFQKVDSLDENTLRGPGVADAKGGLVVLLYALQALERFVEQTGQDRLGWEVIINSDEEIGSPGSSALFREVAQRVQLGLLFEPSLPDGQLVSSRKGSGNFSIVARGRAAHSGRDFHQGINAVVAAADVSTQLHLLNGNWEETTLNVARIDGGGPFNMVPPVAVIRLNVRYRDPCHAPEILDAIQQILDQTASRTGASFELHGDFFSPPKPVTPGMEQMMHQLQSCGQPLGLNLTWTPAGGACDGNRLAAYGVPNIDTLGVRGGKIHSHDEFVLLDSLTERARLTALYLIQLADGSLSPPDPSSIHDVE